MIGVVIPFFNMWHLTHVRLYELYHHIQDGIEIILVDDASSDEMGIKGGIAFWQKQIKGHPIRYYRNPKNLGFGGSCNVGARIAFENANADAVIFLSNDVIISGDFVSSIVGILNREPRSLIGGRIVYWDSGWNTFNFDGKPTTIPYCEGWLIACNREVWERVGGFDPLFAPYDMEDIDLSLTATVKGCKLVALDSPFLRHISGATISTVNPSRQAITENNKQKFFEKWKSEFIGGLEKTNV